jgi:hypothetical protein
MQARARDRARPRTHEHPAPDQGGRYPRRRLTGNTGTAVTKIHDERDILRRPVEAFSAARRHRSHAAAAYAAARARRRLKRSIRPPLASVRARPVYAGWQFEQTSTEIASAVERMRKVVPHEEQRTSTRCRLGCCLTDFLLR